MTTVRERVTQEDVLEKLKTEFGLEVKDKQTRQTATGAGFTYTQSVAFHKSFMYILSILFGVDNEETSESLNDESDDARQILNTISTAAAHSLQPKYAAPPGAPMNLKLFRSMSIREFMYTMRGVYGKMSLERRLIYTWNMEVLNALEEHNGGSVVRRVNCYKVKDGSSVYDTLSILACSVDYMRKHFDLCHDSITLCCDEYVYLVANIHDLVIMEKCFVPYVTLIAPMLKSSIRRNAFLATPLVVDALSTAPPRSRMVKYAMFNLAALLHRGTKDPITFMFKELVTNGDAGLACLGRRYILEIFAHYARQEQAKIDKLKNQPDTTVYYECPKEYLQRVRKIRDCAMGLNTEIRQVMDSSDGIDRFHDDNEYTSCANESDGDGDGDGDGDSDSSSIAVDGNECSVDEGGVDDTSRLQPRPPPKEDIHFTEEDVIQFQKEQERTCAIHCFMKDMSLLANRDCRWCIPQTSFSEILLNFKLEDLPPSLADMRRRLLLCKEGKGESVLGPVNVSKPSSFDPFFSIPLDRNPPLVSKRIKRKRKRDPPAFLLSKASKEGPASKKNKTMPEKAAKSVEILNEPLTDSDTTIKANNSSVKEVPLFHEPCSDAVLDKSRDAEDGDDDSGEAQTNTRVHNHRVDEANDGGGLPSLMIRGHQDTETSRHSHQNDRIRGGRATPTSQSVASGVSHLSAVSNGTSYTSSNVLQDDHIIIPSDILPALIFEFLNHPNLRHCKDVLDIRRVGTTFHTAQQDYMMDLLRDKGELETPTRWVKSNYRRIYSEESAHSAPATEEAIAHMAASLSTMTIGHLPDRVSSESVLKERNTPVHRLLKKYTYTPCPLNKLNLSDTELAYIGLEGHLVSWEENQRGFEPHSHVIQGIHTRPQARLFTRKTTQSKRKKFEKGYRFAGGAHRHGGGWRLNVRNGEGPGTLFPIMAGPGIPNATKKNLTEASRFDQLFNYAYVSSLNMSMGIVPWCFEAIAPDTKNAP